MVLLMCVMILMNVCEAINEILMIILMILILK